MQNRSMCCKFKRLRFESQQKYGQRKLAAHFERLWWQRWEANSCGSERGNGWRYTAAAGYARKPPREFELHLYLPKKGVKCVVAREERSRLA
jgi:hypothetical protein